MTDAPAPTETSTPAAPEPAPAPPTPIHEHASAPVHEAKAAAPSSTHESAPAPAVQADTAASPAPAPSSATHRTETFASRIAEALQKLRTKEEKPAAEAPPAAPAESKLAGEPASALNGEVVPAKPADVLVVTVTPPALVAGPDVFHLPLQIPLAPTTSKTGYAPRSVNISLSVNQARAMAILAEGLKRTGHLIHHPTDALKIFLDRLVPSKK